MNINELSAISQLPMRSLTRYMANGFQSLAGKIIRLDASGVTLSVSDVYLLSDENPYFSSGEVTLLHQIIIANASKLSREVAKDELNEEEILAIKYLKSLNRCDAPKRDDEKPQREEEKQPSKLSAPKQTGKVYKRPNAQPKVWADAVKELYSDEEKKGKEKFEGQLDENHDSLIKIDTSKPHNEEASSSAASCAKDNATESTPNIPSSHTIKTYKRINGSLIEMEREEMKEEELKELNRKKEKDDPLSYKVSDELLNKVKDISVDELDHFGRLLFEGEMRKSWTSQMRILKEHKILTLGDICTLDFLKSRSLRWTGAGKLQKIRDYRKFIEEHAEEIIKQWEASSHTLILPLNASPNATYYECFVSALQDIHKLIEERENDRRYMRYDSQTHRESVMAREAYSRYKLLIEDYYINGKSLNEIGKGNKLTGQQWSNISNRFLKCFLKGEDLSPVFPYWSNVKISDRARMCFDMASLFHFQKEEELIELLGEIPHDRMKIFDIACIDVMNVPYIIPGYNMGLYKEVAKSTFNVLKSNCITPLSMDEILPEVNALIQANETYNECTYDEKFVLDILNNPEFFIKDNESRYLIKRELLDTSDLKVARILYDNKASMTKDEIDAESMRLYKSKLNIRSNEFISYHNGMWHIGTSKESIVKRIARFAEEQKIFYLHDVKQALTEEGYLWDDKKLMSYRAYITHACLVDNGNENHFCLKSIVDDYPEFNWRRPFVYGVFNWVFKEIRNMFNEKGEETEELLIKEVCEYLSDKAKGTEYEMKSFSNRVHSLGNFGRNKSPFLIEEKKVVKNHPVYENCDFETVGLKGGRYPHYQQIRAIAVNELKKTKGGEIRLMDFIQTVNNVMEEPQSRNVIVKAIENKMLEPIPVDFKKHEYELYLSLSGTSLETEPNYKVEIIGNEEKAVEENVVRDVISFNSGFSWEGLSISLKGDLSYLASKFNEMGFDLEQSIERFIEYLKGHVNSNLCSVLPQNLFEYWNNNTDKMDRLMYIHNLCLFYTPLEKGIGANSVTRKRSEFFDKIKISLLENREKCIEGNPIELNSIQTAQAICDYTGLYIFTVANSLS